MTTSSNPLSLPVEVPLVTATTPAASADRWLTELHGLLRDLETVAASSHTLPPVFGEAVDDRLVQVRLGMAASLYAALRCRNAAAAGHSLRVALTCSAWATQMNLADSERDVIEVAALLHDIGVIGTPDQVLLKAGVLNSDEAAVMSQSRKMSMDILRHSCASPRILEIVENVGGWYDGSRPGMSLMGARIPLGARMISIVEAFDAMTTEHVYRPARSEERSMAELYGCAGTQFDPDLVRQFAEFRRGDQSVIRWEVAHRWLRALEPNMINAHWELNLNPVPQMDRSVDSLFQEQLLESMYDAVVFIDAAGKVVLWNRGTERLTGIAGVSVCGEMWRPELLGLMDEKGRAITTEADCPVHTVVRSCVQSFRRLKILGRGQRQVVVDAHVIPVKNERGIFQGTILLFHDASPETTLEQQNRTLQEKATKDPLTQVANRAEFDRVHAMFVATHQQQQVPCSMLMCDLDRFKLVNDNYGHQAGDDAIKSLASLLAKSCRPGDLAARYGGEEFVLLYADCDNPSATRRAEQVRKALSEIPQAKMDGRTITVSIGVTEIQPGDTPETMLRRADRALLMAKEGGRNCVVQLGSGAPEAPEVKPPSRFFGGGRPKEILTQDVVTPVPIKIAIEKLRGFVADHQAKVVAIDGNRLQLEIEQKPASGLRRFTDRSVAFVIDLSFEEEQMRREPIGDSSQSCGLPTTRTRIHISVSPRRNRDRRHRDVMAYAKEVLKSFRSYLIASEETSATESGTLYRAKRLLAPWLIK